MNYEVHAVDSNIYNRDIYKQGVPFGACISSELIVLSCGSNPSLPNGSIYPDFVEGRKEISFWSSVLEHEHLHAILCEYGIPFKQHHFSIDNSIGRIILSEIDD